MFATQATDFFFSDIFFSKRMQKRKREQNNYSKPRKRISQSGLLPQQWTQSHWHECYKVVWFCCMVDLIPCGNPSYRDLLSRDCANIVVVITQPMVFRAVILKRGYPYNYCYYVISLTTYLRHSQYRWRLFQSLLSCHTKFCGQSSESKQIIRTDHIQPRQL